MFRNNLMSISLLARVISDNVTYSKYIYYMRRLLHNSNHNFYSCRSTKNATKCREIAFLNDTDTVIGRNSSLFVNSISNYSNRVTNGCQNYSTELNSQRKLVLGIETSCDDTGAAVVDNHGNVIGEALHNQTKTHIQFGGIIPPVARDLHVENIESVVNQALSSANVSIQDLDAVAVTVKPGLSLSLRVGLTHAQKIVQDSGKPLIPIHHMEAHALTARMIHRIDFPFLVLLASGGHCLLAVAQGVGDFLLLGHGLDDAPGDAFDKTARQLKLKNLPEFAAIPGGVAVERLAKQGNPQAFTFPHVLSHEPNCHFSFSGLKFSAKQLILSQEALQNVSASSILPNVADVCASFQFGVLQHLAKRVQRGLLFCELKGLLPMKDKTLVLSGGVASNQFLRAGLDKVCAKYSCKLVCPPPKLCTDNGIMIAWNGMEKLLLNEGFAEDPEQVDIQARCPLGRDISKEVSDTVLKLPRLKLYQSLTQETDSQVVQA